MGASTYDLDDAEVALYRFAGAPDEPNLLSLAGGLPSVSIKDQLIRAHALVDWMARTGLVGVGRKLLVVGGGLTGQFITQLGDAAGSHTVLIDQSYGRLMKQARCVTRHYCPRQYDFPAPEALTESSWNALEGIDRTLFAGLIATSLRIDRGPVAEVVQDLLAKTKAGSFGWPRRRLKRRFLGYRAADEFFAGERRCRTWTAVHDGPEHLEYLGFHAIVYCGGPGREDLGPACSRPPKDAHCDYEGPEFWGNDALTEERAGIPGAEAVCVLLSGAGDGGLQDLLRVTTGMHYARDLAKLVLGDEALRRLAAHVARIDESLIDAEGCDAFQKLEGEYLDALHRELGADGWREAFGALEDLWSLRKLECVHVARQCTHTTWSYSLNRLMALVVAKFLEERHRCDHGGVFVDHRSLAHVDSSDGLHARLRPTKGCKERDFVAPDSELESFSCAPLVIRHGTTRGKDEARFLVRGRFSPGLDPLLRRGLSLARGGARPPGIGHPGG
jgi:hypothetical protein